MGDRNDWSDSETSRLREVAEERKHKRWLADLLKRWALWITALGVGVPYLLDGAKRAIQFLAGDKS